jgi:hypothetical protein
MELEGLIAAVGSDFLVVGDLRDLTKEGTNFISGDEINEVSLALSGIGVGAFIATVVTGGGAASVKVAISSLKIIDKVGGMPKWLGKSMIESAEIAKKTKNLDHVIRLFSDIAELYKAAGARSTFELLRKSKDLDDFRKLAKIGKTFGTKTSTLLKIAGDDIITTYQRMGNIPQNTFLEAATFGRDGVKALEKYGAEKLQKFFDYKNLTEGVGLRNGHLAGKTHPLTGIPYDQKGYPIFSKVAKAEVRIKQTGTRQGDFRAANEAAGYKNTPEGYTWHHHQNGETMELVPRDIHVQTGHTGGFQSGQ